VRFLPNFAYIIEKEVYFDYEENLSAA